MIKQKLSLKGRALRYLSMREHSRVELTRKLSPYADEPEEVEAVLNWLESSNFMSAERFSDSLVNRRSARFGNQRILAELQTHQLDSVEIQRVKEQLSETELERAVAVLHRKFPQAPADHEERMKQSRFLQQRGFSGKAIQQAMKMPREDAK
ncbi:recombination regulator RecX [Undibacterium sp. SXout20W]|uniref:recombination regulator RecX n=1 Tax=Undibacterium sp. SXout20W TaxID=3413051 RepID=UPI003BF0E746